MKEAWYIVLFNPLIGPLSGATTPSQSGPGSDGNKGVLRIPQKASIAGTSPSDYLVPYTGHSLGGGLTPLQRSSWCILSPQSTGQFSFLVFVVLSFVLMLPLLLLVTAVSISLLFFVYFSSTCLDASTQSSRLSSPLPPFLDTYNLSSLECKALFIVIGFLYVELFYLSSSLAYFNKSSEYLNRGTTQAFIPSMRFLVQTMLLESFLILLRYSYLIF